MSFYFRGIDLRSTAWVKVHLGEGRRRRSLFHLIDGADPAVFQQDHDLIVEKDEAPEPPRAPNVLPSGRRPTIIHVGSIAPRGAYYKQTAAFPKESEGVKNNSKIRGSS